VPCSSLQALLPQLLTSLWLPVLAVLTLELSWYRLVLALMVLMVPMSPFKLELVSLVAHPMWWVAVAPRALVAVSLSLLVTLHWVPLAALRASRLVLARSAVVLLTLQLLMLLPLVSLQFSQVLLQLQVAMSLLALVLPSLAHLAMSPSHLAHLQHPLVVSPLLVAAQPLQLEHLVM